MIWTQEYERINYEREYAPRIGPAFDEAREFYGVGLELLDKMKNSPKSCDPMTKCVLLSNALESAMRYRAVVGLCEIGQNDSAEILVRSLFEGLLAQRCILKPPVGENFLLAIPAGENPTDFIAKVYFHAANLKHERALRVIDERGHSTQDITPRLRELTQQSGDKAREEIGQEWAKDVAGGTTFIGGGVEDLARVYGLQREYDIFYRAQSRPTHANNSLSRMNAQAEHGDTIVLEFNSRPNAIAQTLLAGACWTGLTFAYSCDFFAVPIPEKLGEIMKKAGYARVNPLEGAMDQ